MSAARPILAAAIFAALTPAVALGTVGVAFVMWIGDVNRAKLAKTKAVRDMSLIESAAWLATARDIDGLAEYVEREWVR